jgi:hypothetical protein
VAGGRNKTLRERFGSDLGQTDQPNDIGNTINIVGLLFLSFRLSGLRRE